MTFSITVLPSDRRFEAESAETLLAAGIRQGVGLPYGCKDGACGSCKCKKLSGEVVHGPHQEKALSAAEEALRDSQATLERRVGRGTPLTYTGDRVATPLQRAVPPEVRS